MRLRLASYLVACLTLGTSAATAQAPTKAVDAPPDALERLLNDCIRRGGLRVVEGPGRHFEVADPARLQEAVILDIVLLGPELREALIDRIRRQPASAPALASVLREAGRTKSDGRALGFAAWFSGREAARRLRPAEAGRQFAEAARRFLELARIRLRDLEVDALIRRAVGVGAVRLAPGPGPGGRHIELARSEAVREAVAADRAGLTASLRDGLIHRKGRVSEDETPAIIALLAAIGEVAGDRRASAFAEQTSAERAMLRGDRVAAVGHLKAAAGHYAALGAPSEEAMCHTMTAMIQSQAGQHGPALGAYLAALAILRKSTAGPDFSLAVALNGAGFEYQQLGEYDRAADHLERAAAMFGALRGSYGRPAELSAAVALNNLGLIASHRSEFDKALGYHGRVLEIKRAAYGDRHAEVAFTLTNLGATFADRGDHARAAGHYLRALEIQEAILGPDDWRVATSRSNLGSAYRHLGRYREALDQHERALAIRRKYYGPDHTQVASSCEDLGTDHQDRGDYDKAREWLDLALAIRRKAFGERHSDVASTLAALGSVFKDMGDLGRALEHNEKALAIRRATLGDRSPAVGASLNNIALIRGDRGDHAAAHALLRRALEIQLPAYGERHPEIASVRANLGGALAALDRPREAMIEFRRALEARRSIFGDDHPDVARSLNGIACLRSELGEREGALEDFARAAEIGRRAHGPRHPDVALALENLSVELSRAGRLGESLARSDEAIRALSLDSDPVPGPFALPGPDRLRPLKLTVDALRHRGDLLARGPEDLGRLLEAARSYELAALIQDRARREAIRSEAGRLQANEDAYELYPRLIGVRRRLFALGAGPDHLGKALDAAEAGMARVFLESLGRAKAHAVGGVDADLRAREEALARRLSDLDAGLDRASALPVESRDFDEIARLNEERAAASGERDRFVADLERDHPRYAALKYPRPGTVEEIRACLADDEVGLVLVAGSSASYLIVLEKRPGPGSAGIALFERPGAEEVAELIAAMTRPRNLEDEDRTRTLGRQAYEMLLAPAAEAIRGKGLVVVAGGPLGRLPLELLVEPAAAPGEPSRYLVQGHRIRYAPSLTALHLIRRWEEVRPAPDRTLWALGDPVFQPSDGRWLADPTRPPQIAPTGSRGGPFERLVASGREVERIRDLMGASGSEIVLGGGATEAALKRLSGEGTLARYRYVHFATHGVLGPGDRMSPALVLSLVGDPGGQDGLLELDEVTELNLNADLVVLSACRTGEGSVRNAEGVTGLARSFLHAGSRGVLCSLWRVDDAATADLMADAYAGLKAGRSASDALRSAQLKMIEAGEPPLHWAPFVLIGR